MLQGQRTAVTALRSCGVLHYFIMVYYIIFLYSAVLQGLRAAVTAVSSCGVTGLAFPALLTEAAGFFCSRCLCVCGGVGKKGATLSFCFLVL